MGQAAELVHSLLAEVNNEPQNSALAHFDSSRSIVRLQWNWQTSRRIQRVTRGANRPAATSSDYGGRNSRNSRQCTE